MSLAAPSPDASSEPIEPIDWPALQPERLSRAHDWRDSLLPRRSPGAPRAPAVADETVDPRSRWPAAPLTALARQWLQGLPLTVRPGLIARRHPHVVNRLALAWPDPVLLAATFGQLLLSDRPDRKGFDMDVLAELMALQAYSTERPRR